MCCFFFQAEDGIRDGHVTGVQTCALPILVSALDSTGEVYLENLALILIIGFFFSLLVILVSGRFFAKQAVKPIPRIVRQVKRISASNLNLDRKSTRLNSSHVAISYAVFCLKKQKNQDHTTHRRAP